MNHLEPNVTALSWFVLLWSVCCLAFFQLAGMYPLRASGRGKARNPAPLVLGNTAIWLALLAATLAFAVAELRWTTIIVVAGLLFLFIPELFQAVSARFRDGRAGLAVAAGVMVTALVALILIGARHAWEI
ncbi:MAG TPA: hypothetical protein VKR55_09670 [Bradyrhizobium sp.]|uniref:hypothetical protein n=1 Tax=Bradyrhizobium sp. TaxID=376 RepID=UPI002C5EFF00|nr:hypothetical protein [Bradyrhizobium sp.]HLZ02404.1 hypothetical protein [Bradyrhizobium sp.]